MSCFKRSTVIKSGTRRIKSNRAEAMDQSEGFTFAIVFDFNSTKVGL